MSIRPVQSAPSGEIDPKKKWLAALSSSSTQAAQDALTGLENLVPLSLSTNYAGKAPARPAFPDPRAALRNVSWKPSKVDPSVEQEVLKEGMAAARVISKVLDVLGHAILAPVQAAAIGHYEDFEVRTYMQPAPNPILETVGAAIQAVLPTALKEAPQRFQTQYGIAPARTAAFVGDVVGIGVMAATMGRGGPVASTVKRIGNAAEKAAARLPAQQMKAEVTVYPSTDFCGFQGRVVNRDSEWWRHRTKKTSYNTPKLFTTRDFQLVEAALDNSQGGRGYLRFSAMRCTDQAGADTMTICVDELRTSWEAASAGTPQIGFYRAAQNFILGWAKEQGSHRLLVQHFVYKKPYAPGWEAAEGLIADRITNIMKGRFTYLGEKPHLHTGIRRHRSRVPETNFDVYFGGDLPTFEIFLPSTKIPGFRHAEEGIWQQRSSLVLERETLPEKALEQGVLNLGCGKSKPPAPSAPAPAAAKPAAAAPIVENRYLVPRRGEIYWVDFDLGVGREIQKLRPAVVISSDNKGNYVTVAPIQSRAPEKNFPWYVRTHVYDQEGTILMNQCKSIDKVRVGHKVDTLDPATMQKVDEALKNALGLKKPGTS